jgi:hypothetical protein
MIISVGFESFEDKQAAWRTSLWKLSLSKGEHAESMQSITSFYGGTLADESLFSSMGSRLHLGQLLACELAVSSYRTQLTKPDVASRDKITYGLLLCSLTEAGFIMTHVSILVLV